MARANAIISVPVNPEFPSLNLAQCVLLVGYEWRRAARDAQPATRAEDWADTADIERLAQHYEDRLDEAGFFFPQHKSQSMRTNLRNMWSRMPMTRADVRMLHGVLRQIIRAGTRED